MNVRTRPKSGLRSALQDEVLEGPSPSRSPNNGDFLQSRNQPIHNPEVESWWRALDEMVRVELESPWSEDSEPRDQDFAILVGHFVDPEDRRDDRLARRELNEYINNRAVGFFLSDRTFHVGCRAHQQARTALSSGRLRASFRCPVGRQSCPMLAAIARAGGSSIELEVPSPKTVV